MNLKKTLGAAAIIATAVMPPASAKEIGAPELFWIFFSLAAQHAISPARADTDATPAQGEPVVCDALRGEPQAFRRPALDLPRPGAFCLRQDHVFECAPYGCAGRLSTMPASAADDIFSRHTTAVSDSRGYSGVAVDKEKSRGHDAATEASAL